MYIKNLLNIIWNSPEIMYHIISNTETEAIKNNLAPLIVNNFYTNFLSSDYLENNLLYIITMMLKDEIDQPENINEVEDFLEDTKCGYILEELRKMPDIQIYFKNVICKTVEKIERNYSFREIKFDVEDILNEFNRFKSDEEKKLGKKNRNNNNTNKDLNEFYHKIIKSKVRESCINSQENKKGQILDDKKFEEFIKKYIPDVTINEFKSRGEKAKNENKEILYNYYKKLENDIHSTNNINLYSNKSLINKMKCTNFYDYLMQFYQNDFLEVISFLNQLIEDLMKNILLLPNSIKCICKIITILIKKKFKDITTNEINIFISRFIIEKLLIPIISVPNFNALISDFVISGITVKNIKKISFILKKLFSGKLFVNNASEGEYTPFNWFFMEQIENILKFFDKTTNANLPGFIEKYINNELPEDFCYNYFTENKEDFYANISICFNAENIYHLVNGILKDKSILKKNFPNIELLKKTINKFKMNEILSIDKNFMLDESLDQSRSTRANTAPTLNIVNGKETAPKNDCINYFLYNDRVIEESCVNLFTINSIIANFYIDVKKKDKKREEKKKKKLDEKEKIVINTKNYLCNSLGNYRLLNRSDFHTESTNDTIKMLNEIKTYMVLPNFIMNNNTIPSNWFMSSLLDNINKIPEDYKKDDFKKLFKELTKNLNKSINNLDFEKLILFRNKLKFIDKIYNYYEEARTLINNIVINENIKHIVEEAFIPVDINFVYDEKVKKFELSKSNIKDKAFGDKLIHEDSKKKISFRTIEAFTRYFPNISKYQVIQNINPLDIIKELKINNGINSYFKIIKDKIIKKDLIKEQKYKDLYEEKIKNYIMNKIYEKIYPSDPSDLDCKFFKKIASLSWVEPFQILKKVYIFDNMLPDILNEFKQINKVKTPYRKLDCCHNILRSVINLIQFNEGMDKEVGADEITPVLNYICIKANPFQIYTDIEFIKLFTLNNGQDDESIMRLDTMNNLLLNGLNAEFFELSQEEFDKKCNDTKYMQKYEDFIYNLNS